jgi:hypothetical protein
VAGKHAEHGFPALQTLGAMLEMTGHREHIAALGREPRIVSSHAEHLCELSIFLNIAHAMLNQENPRSSLSRINKITAIKTCAGGENRELPRMCAPTAGI